MPPIEEIKQLLRKLEPVLGRRAKGLWYLNLLSRDPKTDRDNESLLRLLVDKKVKQDYQERIRLPPPDSEELQGEYYIGSVIYPDKEFGKFGLRENEFINHILITGMTGTGKTNLAFQILRELKKQDKPFLIFDWKKNYRDLQQLPEFRNLKVIQLGSPGCKFKFNPLIPPPGIDAKHWMGMLVDVMKHSFFVGHGVEYYLRKGIDHLYKQYGIYQGAKSYPTFIDLERFLRKEYVRGREMLWMASVKRVLASMIFPGLMGEIFNVRQHQKIAEVLKQDIVIEMDNLATIEKIFFIEAFLLWIYEFRKNEGKREEFKHAIVIEEAHHVMSRKKEFKYGEETIIETIIRMIREFGESVMVLDQEPGKVSDSIMANTNCKMCFTLGNGHDIAVIAKAMNLTKEEKRMIDKLNTGHAMVKLKQRVDEPIQVRILLIKLDKGKMLKLDKEINSDVGIP